jgi:hypothetical protein
LGFIDKFIQYNIEQGLTVLVESRTETTLESLSGVSRAAFHHLDFRVTSRLFVVTVALNADPRVYPTSWKGVSTSNHPTALASQVASITGESQISRP